MTDLYIFPIILPHWSCCMDLCSHTLVLRVLWAAYWIPPHTITVSTWGRVISLNAPCLTLTYSTVVGFIKEALTFLEITGRILKMKVFFYICDQL